MSSRRPAPILYLVMSQRLLSKSVKVLSTVSVVILAINSVQADFTYSNFFNTTNLSFNGNSTVFNNALRVTPALESQRGAVWYNTKQIVTTGFDTTFQYNVFGNTTPSVDPGADGFVFVLQNVGTNAIGAGGSGMGFSQSYNLDDTAFIPQALGIRFRTFFDIGIDVATVDAVGNRTIIQRSLINPRGLHTARVQYTSNKTLNVFHNDLINPIISLANFDVSSATNSPIDGTAFVGFTSGTGAVNDNHDVLNWSFTQGQPVVVASATPEPASLALLAVGAIGFVVRRKKANAS